MKKRFSTRMLSLLLAVVMIVSIVPVGMVSANAASYTYDAEKALAFAKTHCESDKDLPNVYGGGGCHNKWLCAAFVSACLKKGGFTLASDTFAYNLGRKLQKYGTKINCTTKNNQIIYAKNFAKTLTPGDIIVWENGAPGSNAASKAKSSGHIVIYAGKNSNGQILVYAHNKRHIKTTATMGSYAVAKYAIHLEGKKIIDNNTEVNSYNLCWPVPKDKAKIGKISSGFGPRKSPTKGASSNHRGIDIPVGTGTKVFAAAKGEVTAVGKSSARGNYVVIYHSGLKISTLYQHLKSYSVKQGSNVYSGQQIALSGSTGVGTGPHLHYGVMSGKATKADHDQVSYGKAFNPLSSKINYNYQNDISYSVTGSAETTYNSATIKTKLNQKATVSKISYLMSTSKSVIDNLKAEDGNTHHNNSSKYECKKPMPNEKSLSSYNFNITKYKGSALKQETNYYLKVTYKIGSKWYSSKTISFKTQKGTPGKPSITVTNANSNIGLGGTSSISWNQCASTDSYDVQIVNNTNKKTVTKNTKGTVYSFDSSIFDTVGTYSVKVTAKNSKYSTASSLATITVHKNISVEFYDTVSNEVIDSQSVPYGKSAVAPPNPIQEGRNFLKWDKKFNDLKIDLADGETYRVNTVYELKTYTVKFVDGLTGALLDTQKVQYSKAATEPKHPTHRFYEFTQWDKDFSFIKEDTTVSAVYEREGKNYPLNAAVISAERSFDSRDNSIKGYDVEIEVLNPQAESMEGRLVIALQSSTGLLLTTTESAAFNMPANTTNSFKVFVPYNELAGYVTVYVVNNYSEAGVIAATGAPFSIKNTEWSEWTVFEGDCPVTESASIEVQTDKKDVNQYRYQILSSTTSYSTSLSGYTRLGYTLDSGTTKTTYYANFHSGFDTSNSLYKKLYGKKVSASENDTSKTTVSTSTQGYIYWHWCEGKSASSPGNHYIGWKKSSTYKKFHAFESTTRKAYKGTSYNAFVYSKKDVCSYNYNWNGYKSKADDLTLVYKQVATTKNKLYSYEKYSDYTDWIDYEGAVPVANNQVAGTNQLYKNVETRSVKKDVYRYKSVDGSATVPDKDAAQVINTLEYNVGEKYSGKAATVFIYKYSQPSDYTNEYIGTTTVENGQIVLSNVQLREALCIEIGDYTVSVSIEGNTGMIEVGKLEAPKPVYTVTYYDYAENQAEAEVLCTVKVKQGETVTAPDKSLVHAPEGCEFDSWSQSTVNVQDNLEVHPNVRKKEVTVVYVDWGAQSVSLEKHKCGEILSAPSAAAVEGKEVSWNFENAVGVKAVETTDESGNTVTAFTATDDAVITTKQSEVSADITFLGLDSEYASHDYDYVEKDDTDIQPDEDVYEDNETVYHDDTGIQVDDLDVDPKEIVDTENVSYSDRVDTPVEIEDNDDIIFYGWKNIATGAYLDNTQLLEGEALENATETGAIYAPVYDFSEDADMPEASVTTGEYTEAQTVELTTETENATIFYTTDGSDPATSATAIEYTAPITISKSCRLQFCASALGMNNSSVVSELYVINSLETTTPSHIVTVFSNNPLHEGSYYQTIVKDSTLLKIQEFENIEGFSFNGLFTDEQYSQRFYSDSEVITESITLYARYTPKQYNVVFKDEDKSVIDTQLVNYLDCAEAPIMQKDGFVFIGWDNEDYECVVGDVECVAQYVPEKDYAVISLPKNKMSVVSDSSIQLTPEIISQAQLLGKIDSTDVDDYDLCWESDNCDVATVGENGLVAFNSKGEATITVTVLPSGESAECKFTVTANPETSITLSKYSSLDINNGYLRRIRNLKNSVDDILDNFVNESLIFYDNEYNLMSGSDKIGTGVKIILKDENEEAEEILDEITAIMTGDYDGNGIINNRDVAMLNNLLVEKITADEYQILAVDVNGDGAVNNRDAAILARYLVGKEVIE